MTDLIPVETISGRIFLIRGHKVILDRDLAELYGVETRVLKQAVRSIERFPEYFMFVLTNQELNNLRSRIVISSWGGVRYPPMAFTGQGVAMVSSVLEERTRHPSQHRRHARLCENAQSFVYKQEIGPETHGTGKAAGRAR
ncbi:MAG: ORF6N domain-containing protein [Deltaproteobacteria bacterium]